MSEALIKELIESGIPDAEVMVTGDGTHFEAIIVSEAFAGKSAVQKHQLVYKAMGDKMGREIHALSMQTLTPEEWKQKQDFKTLNS